MRWREGAEAAGVPQPWLPEKLHFAAPPAASRTVKYYALASALASLVWIAPHIASVRLVPDRYDPLFSAWRIARICYQLRTNPLQLFDGNIFHPARETLTYSDPTLLEGVVAFPFVAAGVDPLIVSNALFLASFPLCALAFFYSAWRLTSDAQAACVAGILGGLSAFKIEHYSHLELQFLCFAPLAVVALLRMLAAPSWRAGAWFGLAVAAQWLACMYLGLMLVVFLVPVALLAAIAWRVVPTRALAAAAAAAAILIGALASITAVPLLRTRTDRGERGLDVVSSYSATPASYAARTRRLATYRNVGSRAGNRPERELFPGTLPLALGVIGMAPPVSVAAVALTAGTLAAFEGSLGTNGVLYPYLYKYVLPFRGLRVPGRFGALVAVGLTLLAAYGARRLLALGRTPGRRGAIFAVLAAGAIVDLRADVMLVEYPDTRPPVYASVTSNMVLAELPMDDQASYTYMYLSTFHWARLVNGTSGYFPPDYAALATDMKGFPTVELLNRLRHRGTTHVTVNCKLYSTSAQCARVLQAMEQFRELEVVSSGKWLGEEVRLYALKHASQLP